MLLAIMSMYGTAGTTDITVLLKTHFPGLDADVAVAGLLRLLRRQDADVAGAHLAARRPRRGAHRRLGHTRRHPAQDGRLRLPPLLPTDVPRRVAHLSRRFVFTLSVVAIIYTSLVALVQEDMKKLIAYSSVAHMGFVTMGLFAFTEQGIQGAIFQMVSHGIVSGALFLCVGVVYDQHAHPRDRRLRRAGQPHAALRRRLAHLHHGQRRPSRHVRLRRRVPDDARHLRGQQLGGAVRRHRRDPVGRLRALPLPPRRLRRARQGRASRRCWTSTRAKPACC